MRNLLARGLGHLLLFVAAVFYFIALGFATVASVIGGVADVLEPSLKHDSAIGRWAGP